MAIRRHHDDPVLFRAAVEFTAAETGFNQRLIEKDYFCSVVLEYLAAGAHDSRRGASGRVPADTGSQARRAGAGLTFKGGTCLTKVHGSLYRLSEDLDFSIPAESGARRGDRRRGIQPVRAALEEVPECLPGLRVVTPLQGANDSRQYSAVVGYESQLDGRIEPVRIEVGLREPILMPVHAGAATTAVLNPINGQALVDTFAVACLAYPEAMAEKLRAALCRREVAIRDFFDVDHAVREGFDPSTPEILDLVRRKLNVPGTGPVNLSDSRMNELRLQLAAQLRPVLRDREFAAFDLHRAIDVVRGVARGLDRR